MIDLDEMADGYEKTLLWTYPDEWVGEHFQYIDLETRRQRRTMRVRRW